MNSLWTKLALAPSADAEPISSTLNASTAWRNSGETRSRIDLRRLFLNCPVITASRASLVFNAAKFD